jgi:hypothetical protein
MSFYLLAHGVAAHDLVSKTTALSQTAPLLLAGAGLGSFGSLIGGFTTGWIARSRRVGCGAIMGVCSVLASLPFWYADPLWYNLMGAVVTLVLAPAGAWLAEVIFSPKAPRTATP